MSTSAQLLANRSDAQFSTGPVTPEGERTGRGAPRPLPGPGGRCALNTTMTRVSQNAPKAHAATCEAVVPVGQDLRLFSTASFVRPEEQEIFDEFSRGYMAELVPQSPLESTLVREIIHAAWRLCRCALAESNAPADTASEDLDRLQASIDRARTAAQRTLHRSLAELRRIRGFGALRAWPERCAQPGNNDVREPRRAAIAASEAPRDAKAAPESHSAPLANALRAEIFHSAKQSQSEPAPAASVARNAPCPCGSVRQDKPG